MTGRTSSFADTCRLQHPGDVQACNPDGTGGRKTQLSVLLGSEVYGYVPYRQE